MPNLIQTLENPIYREFGVQVSLMRSDLIGPPGILNPGPLSGNKWWKLRHNIEVASEQKYETLLTFGGAFSNHIAAVARAGKEFGFRTIGVIRGEELRIENPTLRQAETDGMQFRFVSRSDYRLKSDREFLSKLREEYGNVYIIPEGGANVEGMRGCRDLVVDLEEHPDVVCCACGTGSTLAGIALGLKEGQLALGFSALKGNFHQREVLRFISAYQEIYPDIKAAGFEIATQFHEGGYAKVSDRLVHFVKEFQQNYQVPLDLVYTGKMMLGLDSLIRNGKFSPGTSVLALHTGGLQGNVGMAEQRPELGFEPTN